MRHLGRAVKLEHIARGVEAGEGAARLQRRAAVPADRQVERDDRMRCGEGGINLAIAGAHHQRLGREAGGKGAWRCLGVEQWRQFVGLDRDQIGCVLGEVRVGREHRGDRLTDIAQAVLREQRLPVGPQSLAGRVPKVDRRQIGDVGPRPDGDHSGRRRCRRAVDAAQLGVGIGRANDAHVQLVREADVADELATAGQ